MQPKSDVVRITYRGGRLMAEKLYAGHTFEEVVRLYADTVTGVCVMRLRNSTDAEDCFQNVFCKLYSKSPEFDNDEHLKAWLIRVTTNTCHSYFRNPFRRKRIDIDENEIADIVDTGSSEQDIVNRKVVMDAVMSLPEHYRIIVYLFYYEEYSISQISNILRIKETTIQTRLSRAREKLRHVLADCFAEERSSL